MEQTEQNGTASRSQALATRTNAAMTVQQKDYSYLDDVPIYASTGTHKVMLGSKYWIELREELDYGEQTILDNASVIGVQRDQQSIMSGGDQTIKLDLTRHRFLLAAIWVARANLPPGRGGKELKWPRHINDRVELLKHLHERWGDAITEIVTTHVAARQEEEQAAQDDMNDAAGFMPGEGADDEDDSPPQLQPTGELVVDAQPSQSASSLVGTSTS